MNCLITQTLQWAAAKKRDARPDVVARYLKMRYHIAIDIKVLRQRLMALTQPKMGVA